MKLYALIGHPLKHSFSRDMFTDKFKREGLDCRFQNYDIQTVERILDIIAEHPELCGFNVTYPYKEAIIPLLDELDDTARKIGAVNVVKVENGKTKGYNSDIYGFEKLLERAMKDKEITHAFILGTGGASKAVQYVLRQHNIPYSTVSRSAERGDFTYDTLTDDILKKSHLIINATPLGMMPHIDDFPEIHYQALTHNHILIDLIYNPKETAFMALGKTWGTKVYNGWQMFEEQAKRTWEIFSN